MPHILLKLDADERGFDALAEIDNPVQAISSGKIIHLGEGVNLEIGTLRQGMQSGKDSMMIVFPLPDGRVVLAETSVELFVMAARAITAWQEGRRERGER